MINSMIQDVQNKIASLDSFFKFANTAADKLSSLGTRIIDSVINTFNKVIGIRSRKDDEDYE